MIYLVRHGETDDNKNHIIQGNNPLNKTGKKQIKETAIALKDIKFDVCFCSPLVRTRQTLKEILKYHKKLQVVFDERLIERKYGELVGICYDTIENYASIRWNGNYTLSKTTESVEDIYNRVENFYNDILFKYQDKNILIVAHSGIARMTYFMFTEKPKDNDYTNFKIGNGQILQVETDNGEIKIIK